MCEMLIWDIFGECRTIYITEEQLEQEEQILNCDPAVKEYSVHSL